MVRSRVRVPYLAGAAAAVSCIISVGCANAVARHSACLPQPVSLPTRLTATNGTKMTVTRGALIYVLLAAGPQSGPEFPWKPVRSSNTRVLAPVRLCRASVNSSLPRVISAFRARSAGSAILMAALRPYYRTHPQPGVRTYRAAVIVR